ncbi:MAG: galactokinase, partial [Bacteroidetes bacterium]|nr:galactokinase [Bacteroidota bacterium]
DNGAIGGKIIGAGGGGFFMFYVNEKKNQLKDAMTEKGLSEIQFKIEPKGSEISIV